MNDDGNIDNLSPSWIEDGYGISGDQSDFIQEDVQQWDTNAWTDNSQVTEDFTGGTESSCMSDAGDPPDTGTWVLGSVDGTCQWINTTTCP